MEIEILNIFTVKPLVEDGGITFRGLETRMEFGKVGMQWWRTLLWDIIETFLLLLNPGSLMTF